MTAKNGDFSPEIAEPSLQVQCLRGAALSSASHLTYSRYAQRLGSDDRSLWGWTLSEQRGGVFALALVEAFAPGRARLLSIAVAANQRRRGLATMLLRQVRDAAAEHWQHMEVRYLSRITAFETVQRLLPAAGWGQPTVRVFYGRGDISRADVLKWLGQDCTSESHGWRVLAWDQAWRDLGDVFALAAATPAPEHLMPDFQLDQLFKPTSFFLVDSSGPRIVLRGWLITHKFEEMGQALYYSRFWVDHDFSRSHPLITSNLLRLAIRRQQSLWAVGQAPRFADFDVPLEYNRWLRSVWRHLAPSLDATWGMWGCDLAL